VPLRGLYVQFERRGSPTEYWSGEAIQQFNELDTMLGHTVKDEVALQLDVMRGIGVNVITMELRTADSISEPPPFAPPDCNIPPVLGFQWPHPTTTELANLQAFFDLAAGKGLRILLRLVNTHMEEQPPTNSTIWLGSILGVVKNHPALDLVLFDGCIHLDYASCSGEHNTCGVPAEPALWYGPSFVVADYVRWAISYGLSLGMPPRKLSAEAVAGSYVVDSEPPNCLATDGHMWSPIVTLKRIFDDLAIPEAERTYALSFYEHRKCADTDGLSCLDVPPHEWAEETLQGLRRVVGSASGARIVASELGALSPVEPGWPTQQALESLVFLFEKYGVDGGSFWRWTSFQNSEDEDPTLADPVKRRGVEYIFNKVEKEVLDLGGFHLTAIPNGSFESGADLPDSWTVTGSGTASRHLLAGEAGEPEVRSRGNYVLRLTSGQGPSDTISARSPRLEATPNVLYTTTANLRFAWSGDPNPAADPATRPQIFVAFHYSDAAARPSAIRENDTFRFFDEDATQGFATFPLQYTPPPDAHFVEVEIGVARNGLTTPITLDADNLR
jgi:hypothetical protein